MLINFFGHQDGCLIMVDAYLRLGIIDFLGNQGGHLFDN